MNEWLHKFRNEWMITWIQIMNIVFFQKILFDDNLFDRVLMFVFININNNIVLCSHRFKIFETIKNDLFVKLECKNFSFVWKFQLSDEICVSNKKNQILDDENEQFNKCEWIWKNFESFFNIAKFLFEFKEIELIIY